MGKVRVNGGEATKLKEGRSISHTFTAKKKQNILDRKMFTAQMENGILRMAAYLRRDKQKPLGRGVIDMVGCHERRDLKQQCMWHENIEEEDDNLYFYG